MGVVVFLPFLLHLQEQEVLVEVEVQGLPQPLGQEPQEILHHLILYKVWRGEIQLIRSMLPVEVEEPLLLVPLE